VSRSFVPPLGPGAYELSSWTTDTICFGLGDVRLLGSHCQILTQPSETCASENQKGATCVGYVSSMSHVCRRCGCNAHHSLCNRHGLKRLDPTRPFTLCLESLVLAFRVVAVNYVRFRTGRQAWLLKWPASKRDLFLRSMVFDPSVPYKVKIMVKYEYDHSVPRRARAIQMYFNLITQAMFGPHFYALQKATCELFNRLELSPGIDVTIASGMNASHLSLWMDNVVARGALWFYERDGKDWDSTMSVMHARLRIMLYGLVDARLSDFTMRCVKVKGFGRFREGILRYSVFTTVKSGQNDTSLGNGIVNLAIIVESMMLLGLRGSVIVSGDDLLVAMYQDYDVGALKAIEESLGIKPVARKFTSPFDVSFVSGVWFLNGNKYQFIPKPGRLVARLWWSVNPPSSRKLEAYRRGVVRGLLPVCGGIPIIRKWLSKFDSEGEALPNDRYWVLKHCAVDWDPLVLYHFCARYGVTVSQVEECESMLDALPTEPLFIRHPVLDAMMRVDLADPVDRPEMFGF